MVRFVAPLLISLMLACVYVGDALKLPTYITPCSKADPKLNECALEHSKAVIPHIVKGDPKYHIPAMNPLKVPEIVIDANKDLTIKLKDNVVTGLEACEAKSIEIDLNKMSVKVKVAVPHLNLVGQYDIKGQILVLPINGQGPCNITVLDGVFTYSTDFSLYDKKGKDYVKLGEGNLEYDTKRAYFQLDNLFGGDAKLGEQMNKLLNENWKEVLKDIGPAITEAVSQIIKVILTGIVDRVPYEEIFIA